MTSYEPAYWPDKIVLMYDFSQRTNALVYGREFTLVGDYDPEGNTRQMLYVCDVDGDGVNWVVTQSIISAFFMDISKLSNYDKFLYEMAGKLPPYVDWEAESLEDSDVMNGIVDCSISLSKSSTIRINDWWKNYYISETKLGHF